jgi:hypothetical protein
MLPLAMGGVKRNHLGYASFRGTCRYQKRQNIAARSTEMSGVKMTLMQITKMLLARMRVFKISLSYYSL